MLILAHTEELLDQAVAKLHAATGIEAEKEKADEIASPHAKVVVASIQTLARINRLTGFADNHFTLVICDEAHRALAVSYQRVMRYFHFGAASLAEDWKMPEDGEPYIYRARCLGVTATPDRGDRRSLGEFYQHCAYEYGLLELCREGYLVRPIVRNIPLQIDARGIKKKGGDYDAGEVAHRLQPFLKDIAKAIAAEVRERKTVVFMPSVETAKMLAECLKAEGNDAEFVSGACDNRSEKVAAFDRKGPGSSIVCAILLTEGWDCATVDAVCVLRLTKIRSLYAQCVGRVTRTLPGVIDGLLTREQRLAAIAASAKKDSLILDFFWKTDDLNLVQPVDLVATKPEVRKKMLEDGDTDLVASEERAARDFLKALEMEAKKHARKKARTVDPLALSVSLGMGVIENYVPQTTADGKPPSEKQLAWLRSHGIETANIRYSGLASKMIHRLISRATMRLATVHQLSFLGRLGFPEEKAAMMTQAEASAAIAAITRK